MAANPEPKPPSGAPAATPGRMLVVDDNAELRRGYRRMLQAGGHVVVEAENGREAAQLVSEEAFDVVVSDVQMPDMDGIELLRLIHEADPGLPVILMSGDPDLDSALKAVEYGALEYLTKPVRLEKFRASVSRALGLRRAQQGTKSALDARSGFRERETPRDLTGVLLGGRYRVGALLGSGGMGSVYEATREDLARMPVAIKVLHPSTAAEPAILQRFQREAHTVAALDHPNIVRIIDFQMPEGEPPFLVMERLHGSSLGDALRSERRFSVEEVAFIALQTLAALEAAHRADVIHRDLKADNVFLTSVAGVANIVKLLDFGVAKLAGGSWNEKLTQTGMVVGTPAYMAPEQARGAEVDLRSDLYAVGCMMFEALTGRPPFVADNYHALLFQIQKAEHPSLGSLRPDVDATFAAVIDKALSRELDTRFQTARAMADVVAHWAVPGPPSARQAGDSSAMTLAATLRPPAEARAARRRRAKR
jgi:eukaryotic-like serine/threonine-protein kinase